MQVLAHNQEPVRSSTQRAELVLHKCEVLQLLLTGLYICTGIKLAL